MVRRRHELRGARCVHTKHGANAMPSRRRILARAAGRFCDAFVGVSETTAETARSQREIDAGAHRDHRERDRSGALRAVSRDESARCAASWRFPATRSWSAPSGASSSRRTRRCWSRRWRLRFSPSLQLVIVGDGPLAPALAARVAQLGERARFVHLLGARRDVPRLLCALDLFALSSDSEGLPLVIVEAMATGLPVLSTDVGGIAKVVIDGETGLLAPAGDARALAARVASLAASPTLGVSFGETGRKRALARYSRQRMVDEYFAVYDRVRRAHE